MYIHAHEIYLSFMKQELQKLQDFGLRVANFSKKIESTILYKFVAQSVQICTLEGIQICLFVS